MKRLDLKKAAFDVALATVTQPLAAADAILAAKAGELQLPDQAYQQFRNDMTAYRGPLIAAAKADEADAKKPVPAAAVPVPTKPAAK